MDNLVSLLRAPGAINSEVRGRMLELIQLWASVFEGKQNLSYVGDVYRNLKNDGFDFPPPPTVSSTFIDSAAVSIHVLRGLKYLADDELQPPEWSDADVCMRCRTAFTFTNRKHHCRNCGSVFCGACSSKSIPLPHVGIIQAVRVCDGCHSTLTERKLPASLPKVLQSPKSHSSRRLAPSASMQPRNARVEQDDDDDLKRALQMSLEEAKGNPGYVPQPSSNTKSSSSPFGAVNKSAPTNTADDEDEELKAAIAASLRDMEEQKAKASWTTSVPTIEAAARIPAQIQRPDHELSPAEAENISLFATLVDRLQSQPPGTILREPQIQELYESIGALRPKLARTFGETMSKYGMTHQNNSHHSYHEFPILTRNSRNSLRPPRQTRHCSPLLRPHARRASKLHLRPPRTRWHRSPIPIRTTSSISRRPTKQPLPHHASRRAILQQALCTLWPLCSRPELQQLLHATLSPLRLSILRIPAASILGLTSQ
jgi:growth factor-regulated tyrosine kinase substrate